MRVMMLVPQKVISLPRYVYSFPYPTQHTGSFQFQDNPLLLCTTECDAFLEELI